MVKIRQSIIPVLLLTTVALSSSNVLPIMSVNQVSAEAFDSSSYENDNIFSNKHRLRDILSDIIHKMSLERQNKIRQQTGIDASSAQNYFQRYDKAEDDNSIVKTENYNGEGFRKEQWHNYPRQLDRLHKYFYEDQDSDKRYLDPGDFGNDDLKSKLSDDYLSENEDIRDKSDNYFIDKQDSKMDTYDAEITDTNPLLILKIRLARLSKNLENTDLNKLTKLITTVMKSTHGQEKNGNNEEIYYNNELNPATSVIKVKREGTTSMQSNNLPDNIIGSKKLVKKRIFSLWSRLQGMSPKGHELHHRRHLHAFYNLPDGDGGGVLTAETRATLMRPPGSPLRWG